MALFQIQVFALECVQKLARHLLKIESSPLRLRRSATAPLDRSHPNSLA